MSAKRLKSKLTTELNTISACLEAAKENLFSNRHQEAYEQALIEIHEICFLYDQEVQTIMERKDNKIREYQNPIKYIKWAIFGVSILIALLAGGCPYYDVWQQEMTGKAELSRASHNRQIEVQKAKAASDAAEMYAQAEVARAKGVSESNEIIKDGLGGPEGYLRYLYIEGLKDSACEIIYVPTEAGLPILEAGKRHE